MLYFSSRKDLFFFIIFGGFIFFLIWVYFYEGKPVGGLIINASISGFLLWIWFGTGYRIEGETIKISFGPFRGKINIHEIKTIRRTTHPFTSPSLALKKLEIATSSYDVTYVSPKKEQQFIAALLQVNSMIRLENLEREIDGEKSSKHE